MYRNVIDNPCVNLVNIRGILMDYGVKEGNTKDNRPYRRVNSTVRAKQFYNNKEEISELPVSMFSMKFKKDGTPSKLYEGYGENERSFSPATRYGLDKATIVSCSSDTRFQNCRLEENNFVSKNNPDSIVSTWRATARMMRDDNGKGGPADDGYATFDIEMFILNIAREINANDEETGRLKIRGGIIQPGNKMDILTFFVEDASAVDFIERNYEIGNTARFVGRLRYTSETSTYVSENTWGEAIPKTSSTKKRELIITGPGAGGENGPYDTEELCFSDEDIRVLNADRSARMEQLKIDAKAKPQPRYSWDDDE